MHSSTRPYHILNTLRSILNLKATYVLRKQNCFPHRTSINVQGKMTWYVKSPLAFSKEDYACQQVC